MAAVSLQVPLRRRHSRYELTSPVEVTVLRSGIPRNLPGRLVDAGLGGVSVVVPGELFPGESVGVEFRLADAPAMVQARARVRYQDRIRCGLEFSTMGPDKLELVRLWTDQRYRVMVSAADSIQLVDPPEPKFLQSAPAPARSKSPQVSEENYAASGTARTAKFLGALLLAAILTVGFLTYQRFANATQRLPLATAAADALSRRVMVSDDVMQSLITYRTMPVYPPAAERQGIQGTVLLDTVVGKDGRVLEVRPASGPQELTTAAIDAVKNWRFSPFTLNGDAVEVETTIGVEFRISDPVPTPSPRPKPTGTQPPVSPPGSPSMSSTKPALVKPSPTTPAATQPKASR